MAPLERAAKKWVPNFGHPARHHGDQEHLTTPMWCLMLKAAPKPRLPDTLTPHTPFLRTGSRKVVRGRGVSIRLCVARRRGSAIAFGTRKSSRKRELAASRTDGEVLEHEAEALHVCSGTIMRQDFGLEGIGDFERSQLSPRVSAATTLAMARGGHKKAQRAGSHRELGPRRKRRPLSLAGERRATDLAFGPGDRLHRLPIRTATGSANTPLSVSI